MIPGRDSLFNEFKKLIALAPAEISGITRKANRYFYKKALPGDQVGKLYYRNGKDGKEILLYDPVINDSGKTYSINYFVPSEDGKKVAFGTGTKYPAVICVGGMNDPRVIAWQPGKFAAALQNTTTSGKPVVFDVNYDNGHFTEDKDVAFRVIADIFSFALWQTGNPYFQMKK